MGQPTAIVQMSKGMPIGFYFSGNVRFLVIDESCPSDRVFQITTESTPETIAALIGTDEIGSKHDARHPGITARIMSFLTGKPRLSVVNKKDSTS